MRFAVRWRKVSAQSAHCTAVLSSAADATLTSSVGWCLSTYGSVVVSVVMSIRVDGSCEMMIRMRQHGSQREKGGETNLVEHTIEIIDNIRMINHRGLSSGDQSKRSCRDMAHHRVKRRRSDLILTAQVTENFDDKPEYVEVAAVRCCLVLDDEERDDLIEDWEQRACAVAKRVLDEADKRFNDFE